MKALNPVFEKFDKEPCFFGFFLCKMRRKKKEAVEERVIGKKRLFSG